MGTHLKRVPVLFADIRQYLSYEPSSGIFTWVKSPGYKSQVGRAAGRVSNRGYVGIQFGGRTYSAHRLAWYFVHGQFPEGVIDHIDTDRTNNRIFNLRSATINENARNRRPTKGRFLPKGVSFDSRDSIFRACIKVDGRTIHLGSFADPDTAFAAYAAAATKWHGEFARVA